MAQAPPADIKIVAKDATTGQTKAICGLGPLDTVAVLRMRVAATGLVSRTSHLLHNGKVLQDNQTLGTSGVLSNPVVIVLDKSDKRQAAAPPPVTTAEARPVAASAEAAVARPPMVNKAASMEAAMKQAIKEEYARLVADGMEKSLAAKEAIRRVKDAALK